MPLGVRAALAIVLLVGFYVFGLWVAATLFAVPFVEAWATDRVHPKLALFAWAAGAAVVVGLIPRWEHYDEPGPRLRPADHPRLFAEIEALAARTGQPVPDEVYVVFEPNAFVSRVGGVMGIGSRPVLGLGLGLLQVLTVSELRAVLAHEFGHYVGGDTQLGPLIYRTRAAIARTLDNVGTTSLGWIVQVPFQLYATMFLRLTMAISRSQEFAADALAARIAGAGPCKSSLLKVGGASAAFGAYWKQEFAPVVHGGLRPPLAAGFGAFLAAPAIAAQVDRLRDAARQDQIGDPYDTHPPTAARIAALAALPEGTDTDDRPAVSLLGDVDAVEAALLRHVHPPAAALPSVAWDEVPGRVVVPAWRALLGAYPKIANLPVAALASVHPDARAFADAHDVEFASRGAGYLGGVLVARLAVALVDAGYRVESPVGGAIALVREDQRVDPHAAIAELMSGSTDAAAWAARTAGLGV